VVYCTKASRWTSAKYMLSSKETIVHSIQILWKHHICDLPNTSDYQDTTSTFRSSSSGKKDFNKGFWVSLLTIYRIAEKTCKKVTL
jgi:hypothetical protein